MSSESYQTSPYKILGLPENTQFAMVRHVFKKKILQHHPDKGGDAAYYNILQDAYKFILRKEKLKNQYRDRIEKEVVQQEYVPNLENQVGVENIHVDQKSFDPNKFNKIFDQYKLKDPNMEKGYSENDFTPDDLTNLDFQGRKVGPDEFNRRFTMAKQKQAKDMVVYKEPEPLWSMESNNKLGKNFSLLGEDIDDFGHRTTGLECTDYKKAYETKLIDPTSVEIKSYKSVDQLKSARDNIQSELSEEDKRYLAMKEKEKEERENRRINKMQEFDQQAERNYMEINRRLIKPK
jgi:hypothetical protein